MIPRKLKDKVLLLSWIDDVNDNSEKLTHWEKDFIESISIQLEEFGYLSFKQEDILEKIYADKT